MQSPLVLLAVSLLGCGVAVESSDGLAVPDGALTVKAVDSGVTTARYVLQARIHLLRSTTIAELNTAFDAAAAREVIGAGIAIWRDTADITWEIESIVVEDAVDSQLYADFLRDGRMWSPPQRQTAVASGLPSDGRLPGGWDIYVVGTLGISAGVYLAISEKVVVLSDHIGPRSLRPWVVAHELGHSLSLTHDQGVLNLMNDTVDLSIDPDDKIALTQAQIDRARTQANVGFPY